MGNLTIIDDVQATHKVLRQMQGAFSNLLPDNMSAKKFSSIACLAVADNPKLLQCSRTSLYNAFFTAARLSLWPDGVAGEAYLVIFGDKVQLIPGWKGWIKLCHFSGIIERMTASEVRADDLFDYEKGSNQFLKHKPSGNLNRRVTDFYAYCKTTIGGEFFEVRTLKQIEEHRDKFSKQYKKSRENSVWGQHFNSQAKKTVVHMLVPWLPKDDENRMLLALRCEAAQGRNEIVSSKNPDVIDVEYFAIPPAGDDEDDSGTVNQQTAKLDALFASEGD